MATEAYIYHGSLPIITEGPRITRGSKGMLDSARVSLLCSGNYLGDAQELGYVVDRPATGFASMWVQTIDSDPETEDVVAVTVNMMGLAGSGDRRMRRVSAGGKEWSIGPYERVVIAWSNDEEGEDDGNPVPKVRRRVPKLDGDGEVVYKTIATPSGTGDRWNIQEAIVTVSDTYYVTSKPSTEQVKQPFTPPNPPAVPPYIWGGFSEPLRFRHPNGWVLDDRQIEDVFYINDSLGLWQVTDVSCYYYGAAPD